jgi:hypothetical protein
VSNLPHSEQAVELGSDVRFGPDQGYLLDRNRQYGEDKLPYQLPELERRVPNPKEQAVGLAHEQFRFGAFGDRLRQNVPIEFAAVANFQN